MVKIGNNWRAFGVEEQIFVKITKSSEKEGKICVCRIFYG